MPKSIKEIGETIVSAGKLQYRPICVYGTNEVPKGAVQVSSIIRQGHRCLAKTLLKMAIHDEIPPVYIGDSSPEWLLRRRSLLARVYHFPEIHEGPDVGRV